MPISLADWHYIVVMGFFVGYWGSFGAGARLVGQTDFLAMEKGIGAQVVGLNLC